MCIESKLFTIKFLENSVLWGQVKFFGEKCCASLYNILVISGVWTLTPCMQVSVPSYQSHWNFVDCDSTNDVCWLSHLLLTGSCQSQLLITMYTNSRCFCHVLCVCLYSRSTIIQLRCEKTSNLHRSDPLLTTIKMYKDTSPTSIRLIDKDVN